MGFRPQEKRFRVIFEEGHDLHGLELVTRSVPISSVLAVMRAAGAGANGAAPSVDDIEAVSRLFEHFGEALIEWNLEHPETGDPVEASPAGLATLDLSLVTAMATEWVSAVLGASAPLGPGSRRGGSSPSDFPRASIPMTPLSQPSGPASRAS